MAIVQTDAEVLAAVNAVGLYNEYAADIIAADTALDLQNRNELVAVVNAVGLYDEMADDIIAAGGITFA